MRQIFIKSEGNLTVNIRDKKVSGNYIISDSGVEHSIEQNEELDCFILLEACQKEQVNVIFCIRKRM